MLSRREIWPKSAPAKLLKSASSQKQTLLWSRPHPQPHNHAHAHVHVHAQCNVAWRRPTQIHSYCPIQFGLCFQTAIVIVSLAMKVSSYFFNFMQIFYLFFACAEKCAFGQDIHGFGIVELHEIYKKLRRILRVKTKLLKFLFCFNSK